MEQRSTDPNLRFAFNLLLFGCFACVAGTLFKAVSNAPIRPDRVAAELEKSEREIADTREWLAYCAKQADALTAFAINRAPDPADALRLVRDATPCSSLDTAYEVLRATSVEEQRLLASRAAGAIRTQLRNLTDGASLLVWNCDKGKWQLDHLAENMATAQSEWSWEIIEENMLVADEAFCTFTTVPRETVVKCVANHDRACVAALGTQLQLGWRRSDYSVAISDRAPTRATRRSL